MGKSFRRQDYRVYEFDRQEGLLTILIGCAVVLFFSWFFYRSLWAVLPLSPLGIILVRQRKTGLGQRKRLELTQQFKECILSVSASLQAGYAVENAFLESRGDMENLYGKGSMIYEELEGIRRGLVVNIPLEELLLDLGERSGSEEIAQFARLFSIAKRGGGNLPEMIRTNANLISQKMEARQEIDTLLSGRRMEQMIMRGMPFGIVFYVGSTYKGFFDPLYGSVEGIAVMTMAMALYLVSVWLGEKVFQGIWGQMEGQEKKEKLIALEDAGLIGRLSGPCGKVFLCLSGRFPWLFRSEGLRRNLEMLCMDEASEKLIVRYYGGKMALSVLVFMTGSFVSGCLVIKDAMAEQHEGTGKLLWLLSVGASVAIFFLMDRDLHDRVQKRKERLRLRYPDLVHGLALYLVAGMSIRSAFMQIGRENEMVGYACREMQAGVSEQTAYEHFGKRSGVREYVKLSTLLCQNLKKGSQTLLARLEEEAVLSEEGRIQGGRRLGEEAETKLLIPMVMQLAMIMMMIMMPAFSMMQ